MILCLALNETGGYKFTNGAFNHCAAADQQDMKLVDGVWYGKNPQEEEWKKYFAFHSACENVASLFNHSPGFIEEIKKECIGRIINEDCSDWSWYYADST